jgi:hypothetical protein
MEILKNMGSWVASLFTRITPARAIAAELVLAEMELLRAETGVEYAQALVTYNKHRVARLRAYVAAQLKAERAESFAGRDRLNKEPT